MKRWIIIPRVPSLLVLAMVVLFGLDLAKPGIGQFALIPSLRKSAQDTIPDIPKSLPIPSIPVIPAQTATPTAPNKPPQLPSPPQRADCTAIESYANQCTKL